MPDEFTREDAAQVAQTVKPLIQMALVVDRDQLDQAISVLSKREAAGPLLDPTSWLAGEGEATEKAKQRLIAFRDFHDALTDLEDGHAD